MQLFKRNILWSLVGALLVACGAPASTGLDVRIQFNVSQFPADLDAPVPTVCISQIGTGELCSPANLSAPTIEFHLDADEVDQGFSAGVYQVRCEIDTTTGWVISQCPTEVTVSQANSTIALVLGINYDPTAAVREAEAKLDELATAISDATEQRDQILTELTNTQGQLSAVGATLETVTGELTAARNDLQQVATEITAQTSALSALQVSYATLSTDYNSLDNAYSSLAVSYGTLDLNYDQLATDYTALQSNFNSLSSDYTSLDLNYSSLAVSYNTLSNQVSSLETSQTTLLANVATLQSTATTLTGQVASLEASASTLQSSVSTLQVSQTTLLGDVSTLQSSVNALAATEQTLLTNVAALDSQISTNQTLLYQLTVTDIPQAEAERDEILQEIENLQDGNYGEVDFLFVDGGGNPVTGAVVKSWHVSPAEEATSATDGVTGFTDLPVGLSLSFTFEATDVGFQDPPTLNLTLKNGAKVEQTVSLDPLPTSSTLSWSGASGFLATVSDTTDISGFPVKDSLTGNPVTNVTYSSGNTSVVVISSFGDTITGVSAGCTYVEASSPAYTLPVQVPVRVKDAFGLPASCP